MFTVKQVAKKLNVSSETIRYYTRQGLSKPERDSSNGYRYYSTYDVYLIEFVLKAKHFGLTLHDIKDVIKKYQQGESPCSMVKDLTSMRLKQAREKIQELILLEVRLSKVLIEWESVDDNDPDADSICPLIEKGYDQFPHENEEIIMKKHNKRKDNAQFEN